MAETRRFNFEKFTEVDASFTPRVAIRQNGQIGFSSGAVNKYKIDQFSYCVLYFDADSRVIGVSLEKEEVEGAIAIRSTKANTYIRAKNFLEKYRVDYSSSSRYELMDEKESGILYFELTEESEASEEEKDAGDVDLDEFLNL